MSDSPRRTIGFAPPAIDDDCVAAVERVLRSGWITSGPELKKFEAELESYLKSPRVVCFSSWTTACELALRWFGVGPGDEVLIPAMTYAATANIVLHCGARPVLVDINPEERVVSLEKLKDAWTAKTKVVMPVDLGGWPVNYAGIMTWLKSPEVSEHFTPENAVQSAFGRPLFLSDAAHSFGAKWERKPIGTQADITGFSFHAVKNLTTAEGGALSFSLPQNIDLVKTTAWFRAMSLHGQSKSAIEKTESGTWQYDVEEAGFKCNMTDIQAAIGRSQLSNYPKYLERRREIANRYYRKLSSLDGCILPVLKDVSRESAYHLFSIRIQGFKSSERNQLMQLLKEDGIATNVHFIPLPLLSLHRKRGEDILQYPESAQCFEEQLSLPIHIKLLDEDVDWIAERLQLHVENIKAAQV
ncbi:MAG TPA: capsular biosynthesis protein [Opitutae bacterium]|nr:capsular biosynthesis protein [Opitutae bacterium]